MHQYGHKASGCTTDQATDVTQVASTAPLIPPTTIGEDVLRNELCPRTARLRHSSAFIYNICEKLCVSSVTGSQQQHNRDCAF